MRTFDADIPSAGAYVLCRMMAAGATPRAVVLQGALHRSIAGLIAFNATLVREFWRRGEAERQWMWQHARREYESAVIGSEMVAALGNVADHSIQATSDDADERLRDRMSMNHFRRPFHQRYSEVIVRYLGRAIRPAGYAVA